MMSIRIIGTSHISRKSVSAITAAISEQLPSVIAIELDPNRLEGLFADPDAKKPGPLETIRQVGVQGYVFALLGGYAERKMGDLVGMKPGDEMRHAVILARKHHLPLALIDQDIHTTLKRFSRSFSWKEKGRLVYDLMFGRFNKDLDFDLNDVPDEELIETMLEKVRQRYPGFYRVLITERNNVITRNLAHLARSQEEGTILAVLGAGHKKAVVAALKRRGIEVIE